MEAVSIFHKLAILSLTFSANFRNLRTQTNFRSTFWFLAFDVTENRIFVNLDPILSKWRDVCAAFVSVAWQFGYLK